MFSVLEDIFGRDFASFLQADSDYSVDIESETTKGNNLNIFTKSFLVG